MTEADLRAAFVSGAEFWRTSYGKSMQDVCREANRRYPVPETDPVSEPADAAAEQREINHWREGYRQGLLDAIREFVRGGDETLDIVAAISSLGQFTEDGLPF